LVVHDGPFVDCGTVADYLAANLLATGGTSAVEPGALVADDAVVERSVVWAGSEVHPGEVLVDAVRAGPFTVLVR
ncbi:MAG: Mannose-phosphate guanylyltransferase/MurNAc alpha-phosphate uridylyltransferase, partial [Acidimicrobiales bacterium]|nr:Mannose-phosphate guanylyltransferase/MurNAc alpha-phosphate uridylyltransferase [Acidimicrobiales bacterium]